MTIGQFPLTWTGWGSMKLSGQWAKEALDGEVQLEKPAATQQRLWHVAGQTGHISVAKHTQALF